MLRSRSGPRTGPVSLGAGIPGLSLHRASIAAAGEAGVFGRQCGRCQEEGRAGGLRPEFASPLSHLTGPLTVGVTFLSSV